MSKIKCFAISCSSDAEIDVRKLYVWGGIRSARWLPETRSEAKKRIEVCRKEHGCEVCDAQIHAVTIARTKKTKRQLGYNKN
jgi:hypothetical protein